MGSHLHTHTSGASREGPAAVVAATLKCWDSVSLPHLISFANACVARYAKWPSRETRTPKGSLCWKRERKKCGSWLRGHKARAGKAGRGEAITLGGRLFWTGFGCSGFFVSPPPPRQCLPPRLPPPLLFKNLQYVFRFLICRLPRFKGSKD